MTEPEHDIAVSNGMAAMPPASSHRQNRIMWGLFAALTVILFIAVFGLLWGWQARHDADATKQDNRGLHQQVGALANQVQGLGGTPVTGPSGQAGVPGQNATDAQVQAAVSEYLTVHPVASPRIDYTQLRAYVVEYLAYHPAPSGASGTSGTNGANGKDGRDASDAQVAAAVAAYLTAHPPSPGPTGATGPTGPTGASGSSGTNGTDGQDGQPPVSWTYQVGPFTYECDRTVPFDPSQPTYTCAAQPNTPNGGPS